MLLTTAVIYWFLRYSELVSTVSHSLTVFHILYRMNSILIMKRIDTLYYCGRFEFFYRFLNVNSSYWGVIGCWWLGHPPYRLLAYCHILESQQHSVLVLRKIPATVQPKIWPNDSTFCLLPGCTLLTSS